MRIDRPFIGRYIKPILIDHSLEYGMGLPKSAFMSESLMKPSWKIHDMTSNLLRLPRKTGNEICGRKGGG